MSDAYNSSLFLYFKGTHVKQNVTNGEATQKGHTFGFKFDSFIYVGTK